MSGTRLIGIVPRYVLDDDRRLPHCVVHISMIKSQKIDNVTPQSLIKIDGVLLNKTNLIKVKFHVHLSVINLQIEKDLIGAPFYDWIDDDLELPHIGIWK